MNPPVYQIGDFRIYQRSFYANTLAAHIRLHSFIAQAHKHDFYLVVLFTKGTGTHDIDFNTYTVKKGAAFLMIPGQTHAWNLSSNAEGYIFFHSGEAYNLTYANKQITDYAFFSSWQNHPVIYLDRQAGKNIEPLFERIIKESQQEDSLLKFQTLVALIDLVYLDLSRHYKTHSVRQVQSSVYQQKTEAFKQLIDASYKSIRSPSEYAGMLNISARHLNRIVKETLGKTSIELIADRIMLEAKRVLTLSDRSTKEIAFDLGFDDVSYFIRFFKKHSKETPASFQKNQNHM
ncbi:MAG: helix-turn-helix transcriptional regulator [Bacteroidota bacterium]